MTFFPARFFFWFFFLFLLHSCSTNTPQTKSHHTSSGFKNPNPQFEEKGLGSLLKWVSFRWQVKHSIDPEDYPAFPIQKNDGALLRANSSRLTVTWIGHASTLIQIDGINILTDPIWSERCSPVSFAGPKRFTPPGLNIDDLPQIDVVILSHNHYDHMDLPTLKILENKFHPKFLAGLGNRDFLINEGLSDVTELDWWDEVSVRGLNIHFTPTQHFTGRGIFDRFKSLWGSYVVNGKSQKVYFAGDTGYYSHFKEIGEKFGEIDVAILPVGAFEPRWFMSGVHVDPAEAVRAFEDLKAKYFVPMHYMTFVLADEKLDSPIPLTQESFRDLKIDITRLIALKIGESRFF